MKVKIVLKSENQKVKNHATFHFLKFPEKCNDGFFFMRCRRTYDLINSYQERVI